jgi:hypothetical protein
MVMYFTILILVLMGALAFTIGSFIKVCRLMNGCIASANSVDGQR